MSYTFTFDNTTSILEANFTPLIDLRKRMWSGGEMWSDNGTWVMGLLDFTTYHTIPNIDESNQNFYYGRNGQSRLSRLVIPTGAYTLEDLNSFISSALEKKGVNFELASNNNTQQAIIKCDADIDFTVPNSLGDLLGFGEKKLKAAIEESVSEHPVKITRINVIRILCNITSGSYRNGEHSHVIHEFFPKVAPGFKIVEIPPNIVYLPINTTQVDKITLRIVDQNNRTVDFRGEPITIRLHLKRISYE